MTNYDMSWRQGDDVSYQLTLKDSLGVAMNLDGYTVRSQIRARADADDYVAFSVAYTRGSGIATLSLTDTQTAAMGAGTYRYDVELVEPSGSVKGIMGGSVTVTEEITK
jgi:hypothetical protein